MIAFAPYLAFGALAAVAAWCTALAVGRLIESRRAARLYEAEETLLREQIRALANPVVRLAMQDPQAAWAGFRKFVVRAKVLEASGICSFYLAPHDGQPLPPFLPGQYLTFQLPIPGQGRPVVRCYSLSDAPLHSDYYRITVKRLLPPPGDPQGRPGLASTWLHQRLAAGDLVDVRAPAGHFHLDVHEHTPVVLIAGGIGITPLLSMLNYLTGTGSTREVWLFYGVHDGSQHIMKAHLRALAHEHEHVNLRVCYSRPRPEDVAGRDYDHAGRVTIELLRETLPGNNYEFYVCGPAGMMAELSDGLAAWGVPQHKIHHEAFGADTVRRVHHEPEGQRPTAEVTFARSERVLSWDGTRGSLLEFAEANGIFIDSGCRAGNCGTCATPVREGDVSYLTEPGAPVEDGMCLACIAVPKGPLVVDA